MNNRHPSEDISATLSDELSGKTIILALCGSVAVLKSIELARLLMRHGSKIIPVMSQAAADLVTPDLVHWATGISPVTSLSGAVEHVHYAGNTRTKADLLLIAPATANTIGKIANGIDDTTVTTFATTAIGEGIPVIIVPAMHEPMYRHPAVKNNISQLQKWGIRIVMPKIEEGKAKFPEDITILEEIRKQFHNKESELNLKGEKILITAGRTVEYLDQVRTISNNSSGKMGIAIAEEAQKAGAEVTLIIGKVSCPLPPQIRIIRAETSEEMSTAVKKEISQTDYNRIIAAAAVGDWKPQITQKGKISTRENPVLTITLIPTEKILDCIREWAPSSQITAFRAIPEPDEDLRYRDAFSRMKEASADFIAVNDISAQGCGFETDTNRLLIIGRSGSVSDTGLVSKKHAARLLLQRLSDERN